MENKKLVAIASADWHIHKWQNFDENNSRLDNCLGCADMIIKIAANSNVPLLFAGDLAHSPKGLETETGARLQKLFQTNKRGLIIGIPGNHDMCQKNSLDHRSPNHMDGIENFIQLNAFDILPYVTKDIMVWGVPYMNNDRDTKKAILRIKKITKRTDSNGKLKILLLHTDLPGAKTPEGFTVNETESFPTRLDKLFNAWDLVLCGHIHLPQKLGRNCWMLGPNMHQTIGDEGHDFGYWEVYSDKTMKFKKLNYPQFISLKKGEVAPDNKNYYVPYNEVLVDEDIETGEFSLSRSKKQLAITYMKTRQIKSKSKKRALIKILNETE